MDYLLIKLVNLRINSERNWVQLGLQNNFGKIVNHRTDEISQIFSTVTCNYSICVNVIINGLRWHKWSISMASEFKCLRSSITIGEFKLPELLSVSAIDCRHLSWSGALLDIRQQRAYICWKVHRIVSSVQGSWLRRILLQSFVAKLWRQPPFSKVKVKMAARVMSRSVAAAPESRSYS